MMAFLAFRLTRLVLTLACLAIILSAFHAAVPSGLAVRPGAEPQAA
jgi:hypothetical protein